ncbi:MAG TPA: ATP-binding cassette domain-containing protein [Actinomycetota bacterium]|nr:ATP-binding cassette domain-containing protein [Actinomycetota bacterium]
MTTSRGPAIVARGLRKSFGDVVALDGVDLTVQAGTVFGLLGPNGAGKTTAVKVLTTLLKPDQGTAEVAGLDVTRQSDELRSRIGLTGQYAAVDEYLTGRENLEMFGRLYNLPRSVARRRAEELLAQFELADAGSRVVKTFSGGMRRRLDLAASLIFDPEVLFLDEPTTGLDPRGRLRMWDIIEELAAGGATILLTTQYMEEADRLADLIAVLDRGRVIAEGTADQLKDQIGGERLEVTVSKDGDLSRAVDVLRTHCGPDVLVEPERRHAAVPVTAGPRSLAAAVRELDAAGIHLDDLSLHRPTLDDVFLTLTGRVAEPTEDGAEGDGVGEEKEAVR